MAINLYDFLQPAKALTVMGLTVSYGVEAFRPLDVRKPLMSPLKLGGIHESIDAIQGIHPDILLIQLKDHLFQIAHTKDIDVAIFIKEGETITKLVIKAEEFQQAPLPHQGEQFTAGFSKGPEL